MDIDEASLSMLLRRAPSSRVGYSHVRATRAHPNVWIMAIGIGRDDDSLRQHRQRRRRRGTRVGAAPSAKHRADCLGHDGQVTDSHDHPDDRLTLQCAELVRRHRIRLVRSSVALGGPFRTVERRAVPSGANLAAWAENSWKCTRFSPLSQRQFTIATNTCSPYTIRTVFVKGSAMAAVEVVEFEEFEEYERDRTCACHHATGLSRWSVIGEASCARRE